MTIFAGHHDRCLALLEETFASCSGGGGGKKCVDGIGGKGAPRCMPDPSVASACAYDLFLCCSSSSNIIIIITTSVIVIIITTASVTSLQSPCIAFADTQKQVLPSA